MLMFEFYQMDSSLGYDCDGNPTNHESPLRDKLNPMLLHISNVLNITDELTGKGYGYVFLKELKDIGEMFSNSAPIFEYVFHECTIIFDFPFIRLLWNCFSDIFIDNRFVIKFLLQLKFLFGIYKDDDVLNLYKD